MEETNQDAGRASVHPVVMQSGIPCADTDGGYWWFKPDSPICPEPQALFVRWVRGAVRAVYGGELVKVDSMRGQWCGPIPLPKGWGKSPSEIPPVESSESHWRLQYTFACRVLANFIELIDAADGCLIEPPPEVIEIARFHAGKSA